MPRVSRLQRSAVCDHRAVGHHICYDLLSAILTEVVVALQSAVGSSLSEKSSIWSCTIGAFGSYLVHRRLIRDQWVQDFPLAFDNVDCYRDKECWRYISGKVRHASGIKMMWPHED